MQALPNIETDQSGHSCCSSEPSLRISTNFIRQAHLTVVGVSSCRTKSAMVEADVHHLSKDDPIQLTNALDRAPVLGEKTVDVWIDNEVNVAM